MTGNIKRTTPNYGFRIPYFDRTGWGREMERNFDVADAALFASTGLGGIVGTWTNSTVYDVADRVVDPSDSTIWVCNVEHVSAGTGTFAQDRAARPTYWTAVTSSFAYRGQWLTGTQYNVNDIVFNGYSWALSRLRHVSGASFAGDLADNKLTLLFDGTATVTAAQLAKTSAEAAQAAAAASASAAAASQTAAAGSATSAGNSATTALGYRNQAQAARDVAITESENANLSAIASANSATSALTQAGNAATSALAAAGSAATASTKATDSQNYSIYAQQQAQLAASTAAGISSFGGYRNKFINGDFIIWQRSTTQNTEGYGSDDRWVNNHIGSTKVHTRQSFTPGQTDVPGNPIYFSRTVVTSVAGAGNFVCKGQRIEDVTALSGKTVTITFYAKSNANRNMAVDITQFFGVGGSPSISIPLGLVSLTTSWKRFDLVVTLPSVIGKTLGANHVTQILLWFDAGSNFNVRTSNLGQQSGTFDIAHVSVVEGDARQESDPHGSRPPQLELLLCQRFCCTISTGLQGATTGKYLNYYRFPTEMRAVPTKTVISAGVVVGATLINDFGNPFTQSGFFQINVTSPDGYIDGYTMLFQSEI